MARHNECVDGANSVEGVALGLRHSADSVADSIVDEIVATIPSYAVVARSSLRRSLLIHGIDTTATSLTIGDVPDHVQDVSVAAERARSGIPIEHVLLAVRLTFQRLREFVTDAATELGISPSLQLEAVRILWEVNDLVSREYAVAHREEDLQMARTADDEVVPRLQRRGQSLLVDSNPFSQLELAIQRMSFHHAASRSVTVRRPALCCVGAQHRSRRHRLGSGPSAAPLSVMKHVTCSSHGHTLRGCGLIGHVWRHDAGAMVLCRSTMSVWMRRARLEYDGFKGGLHTPWGPKRRRRCRAGLLDVLESDCDVQ